MIINTASSVKGLEEYMLHLKKDRELSNAPYEMNSGQLVYLELEENVDDFD